MAAFRARAHDGAMDTEETVHDETEDRSGEPGADRPAGTPPPPPGWVPGNVAPPRSFIAAPPGQALRRSRDDNILTGLSGGIARHFGVPALAVRLAFVVLALAGGVGVLLYVAGWVLVPLDGDSRPSPLDRPGSARALVGVIVLAVAALALLGEMGSWFDGAFFVPVALAGIGVWLLLGGDRSRTGADPAAPDAPRTPTSAAEGSAVAAPPVPAEPGPPPPPQPPPSRWEAWRPPPQPSPRRLPRERSALGRLTAGLVLVLLGVAALVDSTGTARVDWPTFLAVPLLVCGGALVLGAWWGRARGLVALGIVLTFVAAAAAMGPFRLRGGVGERIVRPATSAQAAQDRALAAGHLRIDLRETRLAEGTTHGEYEVGVGYLEVVVPRDVTVEVEADVGLGEYQVLGRRGEGAGLFREVKDTAGTGTRPRLRLTLDVGVGKLEVRRASS